VIALAWTSTLHVSAFTALILSYSFIRSDVASSDSCFTFVIVLVNAFNAEPQATAYGKDGAFGWSLNDRLNGSLARCG
jgi:hypothetical protein